MREHTAVAAQRNKTCLTDREVLAKLLAGTPRRRRLLARRLLDETGSLWLLRRLHAPELLELGALPDEAERVLAAFELGRRAAIAPQRRAAICEPAAAYRCLAPELKGQERERFVVVVLDVKNRPCHIRTVALGGVDHCPVDLREVFTVAVRERGAAVLVGHNHPSGDPTPSAEDLALTARLQEAGALMGIPLVDHLIVADGRRALYVSMAAMGYVTAARHA